MPTTSPEDAAKVDRRVVSPRRGNPVGVQPKRATQLSLFESARYYIRDGTAHYPNAYPGKAFEIGDADAATFKALDPTYGRDASNVCVNGAPLADADARSFEVLDRPGFAKDRRPRLSARTPDQ